MDVQDVADKHVEERVGEDRQADDEERDLQPGKFGVGRQDDRQRHQDAAGYGGRQKEVGVVVPDHGRSSRRAAKLPDPG